MERRRGFRNALVRVVFTIHDCRLLTSVAPRNRISITARLLLVFESSHHETLISGLSNQNNVERGEALLAKIGAQIGLTPCGTDWLIAALDPFHDNQLEHLTGWPDEITTPSVLRQVKASAAITFAAGVPQDVYIVAYPWLSTCQFTGFTTTGGNTVNSVAVTPTVITSPVSVYAVTPGTSPVYSSTPSISLNFPSSMQSGKGRLVGMGYELLNVTAPIQRSGTLYAWRLPGLEEEVETYQFYNGAVLSSAISTRRLCTPPRTVAQAELIPGTRSWAAEEGSYQVLPFVGDNPALYPSVVSPVMLPVQGTVQVDSPNVGQSILTGPGTTGANLNRLVPSNLMGTIVTGLNDQAKLTLNVVWFYEEFPDVNSPVLTLATPSCEYDPLALALYTEVLNSLPVAVPSSWNVEGSWWWDVVTAIKNHATETGKMIGGVQGAAVGAAASHIAGWAQGRYLTSPGAGGSGIPRQNVQGRQIQKKKQGNKPKTVTVVKETIVSRPVGKKRQPRKKKQTFIGPARMPAGYKLVPA